MSEGAVQAAAAAGAGVGAVVVSLIGVEPQVLFWAMVGAGVGIPFAPPAGRFRAGAVFVLVVLASALLGTWCSLELLTTPAPERQAFASKGFSLVLGLAFHPLTSVVVASIPRVWAGLLRKFGVEA